MIASCLTLTGAARMLGLPRWRLWMLIRTGRFIPPDHTDAAGRDHWDRTTVLRWSAETARGTSTDPRD